MGNVYFVLRVCEVAEFQSFFAYIQKSKSLASAERQIKPYLINKQDNVPI